MTPGWRAGEVLAARWWPGTSTQSPRRGSGEATYIVVVVDSATEILIQNPDIILYRFNALHMHENKLSMCQEKALVLVGAFSVIVKLQY